MEELMEALRNYGSFNILSDIIEQGYAKREKGTERAKTIPIMLEQWLEAHAPTEADRYTNREIDRQVWDYYGAY